MWTKGSLCDTAKSFMKHTIRNLTDRTVFIQSQNRLLAIMISGNENIFVLRIRRNMAAAHSFDIGAVQPGKCAVLHNTEGNNTFICY